MASKSKKKVPPKSSASDRPGHEVERLIGKGHFKDAVKQAKIGYKAAATAENHRLLERAYFLRAQQLYQSGMVNSAVEVAQHLVEFGVTDPSLAEDAARLLLTLGLSQPAQALQKRIEDPEVLARFALLAADQAVLHPERLAADGSSEAREGALAIRAALEAVEAGDEAKAVESLRPIARSSPFADWKLFARGLAAYRRRDVAEAKSNWDRLDPNRAAVRISRWLLGTEKGGGTAVLERLVFGEPVLAPILKVSDLLAEARWFDIFRELGPIRFALRRTHPDLAQRLTRALIGPLIAEARRLDDDVAERLVQNFTRIAEPLAIDPRWNRLRALVWEGPEGDFETIEEYWRDYLEDLKTLPSLALEERILAQALVWHHIAELYLEDVQVLNEHPNRKSYRDDLEESRRRAIDCLEESLRLYPAHLSALKHLLMARLHWGTHEQVVTAAQNLLAAFPNDLDTLVLLAERHSLRDENDRALELMKRARALKPLDPKLIVFEWTTRVSLARQYAFQKRWDEGRGEFAAAEALPHETSDRYALLAKKAAFEIKAGQASLAETLIGEAEKTLVEPTPLWLSLAIESVRYKLPKGARERFNGLLDAALKKKCRSETAGEMAGLLLAHLEAGVEYTGRSEHVRKAVAYLGRTTRMKYRREDLEDVCEFLDHLEKEAALRDKLALRGLKDFPDSAYFLFSAGRQALKKGPIRVNLKLARERLEKALKLAHASDRPKDVRLIPVLKEGLGLLSQIESQQGLPFLGSFLPPGFADMFEEMFEREGIDPDDVFGDFFDDDF
jgi:tetratricopeptide (TPR) repeat protein